MQKLQHDTSPQRLARLKDAVECENENREYENLSEDDKYSILNIPFLISSLWEAFRAEPNTYSDFIECLNKAYDYQILITEPDNDYYGICKAIISFCVSDNMCDGVEDYQYEINFNYDPRDWGYCECTSDMKDYREDKHCCGHGCDWWAPAFEMRKSFSVSNHKWHGDEHDYWDFEDEFYASNKELADKKAEEDRLREIKELKNQIETASKKLKELVGDKV